MAGYLGTKAVFLSTTAAIVGGDATIGGDLNAGTIKDATGTNTALTIDSNGVVDSDNRFIGIYKSGNQSLTANTYEKVTSWTVSSSNGLTWDATNNKVIIDKAGSYLINYSMQIFSSNNDLYDVRQVVYKNGAAFYGTYSMIVGGSGTTDPYDLRHSTTTLSNIFSFSQNDELELYVFANGTGLNVYAGDTSNPTSVGFSAIRVGD